MFIPRLYTPPLEHQDEVFVLDKTHSHYVNTVLRLKSNDAIVLFNGQGGEYQCHIGQSTPKEVTVRVEAYCDVSRESTLQIHLAAGLSRGDRFDFVCQKATELGVTSITPLLTDKTQVKLDAARLDKKLAHWQAIMVSAAEQSGRTTIPAILTPIKLKDYITQTFNGDSLFCSTESSQKISNLTLANKDVRLAIGPESGWTNLEETLLKNAGFTPCALGPRILRTETAPIAALSILQACFGDI